MDQSVAPGAVVRQPLPRNVKVLGAVSLVNDIASEMVFPLLPTFLLMVLSGNLLYLGIIEGLAETVASFLKLWSGGQSDRAERRKRYVVFGYSLAALTRPLIGLIVWPWQLLVLRVADRLGKGIRTSPRDAMIADSTHLQNRGRAFGFHRAMDHLGAAIGPLLTAGFLFLWPGELRTLFVATLVPGILVVLLLIFGLREATASRTSSTEHPQQEVDIPRSSPTPVPGFARTQLTLRPFDRNFRLYLLALVIFTLGNSSDLFLLVRASEWGVEKWQLPLLWCGFHILKSVSSLYLGRAVDRVGSRPLILLGWVLYAGVYLAFGWATTALAAWLLFLGYALFYGLTEPAERTLVASLAGRAGKGLAFGWYNCAIGVATLPSSLIFGAIYQFAGPLAAFGWSAALALIAVAILMGVRSYPQCSTEEFIVDASAS